MSNSVSSRWPYFPLFLKLQGQRVLLVGAGTVAARKLELLLRAGASVEIVAPDVSADVRALREHSGMRVVAAQFAPGQLRGCKLAIAATDDAQLNRAVAQAATHANIPVNVVDDVELSTCIMPAVVDRAPLLAAISTGGAAPVLARRVRA
ncbi:MAG TPA: bifunctional precorrin-2 dehydrogenase/sirohydrochlorin ferrochelatase, partial [Nevskiaceae bacterium]|nr:bifunctional precorrin-2 dehydrogenase/sirohydrochlorin ferrochelatase [Nevskiaceae bacterium]